MGSSSSDHSPAVSAEHKPASHSVEVPPVNSFPPSLSKEPLTTALGNPMFNDDPPASSEHQSASTGQSTAQAARPATPPQGTSEIEPQGERATALGPATPAQERRRRLDSAPAAASALAEIEAFTKPRRKKDGRQRSGSLEPDAQRRARQAVKRDALDSGPSTVAVQGQDTLEVRTVMLANGQKASLILEDGRLQRIVAANGQVAELRWQAPSLSRVPAAGASQPPLAVKLHGATAQPPWEERSSSQVVPPMIKRWAHSLSSQRLTTGPDAPYPRRNSLMTAPTGYKGTDNSRDSRSVHSLEIMTGESLPGKKKGFLQSLFSAPLPNAKAPAAVADMPTIMETNREVNRDWNPIHESWLPTEMTTQFLANTPLNSQGHPAAQPPEKQEVHSGKVLTGNNGERLWSGGSNSSMGRSATRTRQDPLRAVTTQSADVGSLMRPRVAWAPEENPAGRRASTQEPNFRLNAALYDTDPGPQQPARKKGFWAALKRVLHFPSISKTRGDGTSGTSEKRRSIFSRRSKTKSSFAFSEATSAADALADEMQMDKRMQSMSALPDRDTGAAAREATKPKSASAYLPSYSKTPASEARPQPGGSIPATPQQREAPGVVNATPTTPPEGTQEAQSLRAGESSDGAAGPARSLQRSLDLAQGMTVSREVQEALALHDQSSNPLLSQMSNVGEEGRTPRTRRSRRTSEPGNLMRNKARTMMAGKWQKNFTEGTSGIKVDELLQVSSLHRLARERIVEMEIVETEETFEMVWHIPLNGSASKISKTDRYLKNGEVVEAARRDGRPGVLRSQLTFTPEGHVHIRALQGEPFQAVFHDRIKLSTGGRRIKIEQKFQLLQPGVLPVKHYSIWNRVE